MPDASRNMRRLKGSALLIHGITGTPAEMQRLADYFTELGLSVSLPLLTGHGTSIEEMRYVSARTWLADAEEAFRKASSDFTEPVILAGLSFGSLLSLHLATKYPQLVRALVAFSMPLRLRSSKSELLCGVLSVLPDPILNRFGIVPKIARPENYLAFDHVKYDSHSVAAVTRIRQIRRQVLRDAGKIVAPLFIAQDPDDHHITIDVPDILLNRVNSKAVTVRWFPGGQHEIVLGHSHRELYDEIGKFLLANVGN